MKLIARTLAAAVAFAPAIALANNDKNDQATRPADTTKAATAAQTEMTGSHDNDHASGMSKDADHKMTDAQLASMLHQVNKQEIDAGKLAEKMGHSQGVKDYGSMLVKDHQDADAKLSKLNLDLNSLNAMQKEKLATNEKKMDQVKKMKGAEFDKAFADVMYNGHDHVLDMLGRHAGDIQSAELKQYVDDMKPALEHHKDMANDLKGKMNASTSHPQGRTPDRK